MAKKKAAANGIVFLCLFMSSMSLIRVNHILSGFRIMEIVVIAYGLFIFGKLTLIKSGWLLLCVASTIITAVLSRFGRLSVSYKNASTMNGLLLLLTYISACLFIYIVERKMISTSIIVKALRWMCLVQAVWCISQFVLYHSFRLDINTAIFTNGLGIVETASAFKDGVFQPSGLNWHAAVLAPVIVIGYFLYDNIYLKLLFIFVGFLTGNATATIGATCCFTLDLFPALLEKRRKKLKKFRFIFYALALLIMIAVSIRANLFSIGIDKLNKIIARIFLSQDASARAHIRYYTSYPQVVAWSKFQEILFGFGEGCSGFPMSRIFEQYAFLGSWAVETDIMNILYSRGIIGFIAYYGFLIDAAAKSSRIDRRYAKLFIFLIIEGVTYNIQFEWVLFIEILLWRFSTKESTYFMTTLRTLEAEY